MATSYAKVKDLVIDLIDDCSDFDIVAGYGSKYSAKTKLTTLGISNMLKAFLCKPLNKRMRELVGNSWRRVGPADLAPIATIGKLIERTCGQGGIPLPAGEPT